MTSVEWERLRSTQGQNTRKSRCRTREWQTVASVCVCQFQRTFFLCGIASSYLYIHTVRLVRWNLYGSNPSLMLLWRSCTHPHFTMMSGHRARNPENEAHAMKERVICRVHVRTVTAPQPARTHSPRILIYSSNLLPTGFVLGGNGCERRWYAYRSI
jgi:hypothetical protein